jgi:VWFA-related protein
MKNVIAAVMFVGTLVSVSAAQTPRTVRPRVAPTATPPVITNDSPRTNDARRPPVLQGSEKKRTDTTPQNTPAKTDEDEIVKVETNLVTMPVSVLDREGRFISGLEQRDFRIFENGVEQRVEYFQSVEQPFTVILMIDVSPSTQWQIEDIQQAAITFIDQLRPNDKVMVIAFDESVQILSEVTNNRNQLKNAVRRARFGDGTSLYEAVDHVLRQQLSQIQGRKAVVLFTDGVDTTSRYANYQSTVGEAEETDALFYPIRYDTSRDMDVGQGPYYPPPGGRRGGRRITWGDILGSIITGGNVPPSGYPGGGGRGRGAGNTRGEYETGQKYLEALARNSGGRKFEADSLSNLDVAFAGIAEELRRQYSLGYYPDKVGQIGERKQISIRVNRPGVVVRAKNTYIVGQTDRRLADK